MLGYFLFQIIMFVYLNMQYKDILNHLAIYDILEQLQSHLIAARTQSAYIVAAKRTPIGGYMGKLSTLVATDLGAVALKAAVQEAGITSSQVDEVILGNVLSAGVGQAPARQVATKAGLSASTTCTTINKVCSSGLKAVVYGSQSIALGNADIVGVGGFESMSNAPHLVMNGRKGVGHGDKKLIDHLTYDGLTDPFKHISMGLCAEKTAAEMQITRQQQDDYCKLTFKRHMQAVKDNHLKGEIVPVQVRVKGKDTVVEVDEEASRYKEEVVSKLKPAFEKNGTITGANASKINDGACALILMSATKVKEMQVRPMARILAYADSEIESVDFCVSPYYATVKALKKAGLSVEDIAYFEFNEAFSIVPIAMMRKLNIPQEKVNVFGGAVAMGHPIGASGARILQSLLTVMKVKGGKYGLAGICNGGGGSTALIIQNLQ